MKFVFIKISKQYQNIYIFKFNSYIHDDVFFILKIILMEFYSFLQELIFEFLVEVHLLYNKSFQIK
jgi:hypothetical protein